MGKERLDVLVIRHGFADAREKAKRLIMAGEIYVDGQKEDKAGMRFDETAEIEYRGNNPLPYVGRGGLKLEKALKVFPVDPAGKICLDCGASTGGFTDVLLQHGAAKVYAVDVGYGQLAWKLRTDERVVNLERTNLRYITEEQIPDPIDLAVMDVSFISIRLILPVAAGIMGDKGRFLTLVKPQFEAGRGQVGKNGVVRDEKVHRNVLMAVRDYAREIGWHVAGFTYSPIKGPKGNIEFLADIRPGEGEMPDDAAIIALVDEAHRVLD